MCPYQSLGEYTEALMPDLSQRRNDVDEGTEYSQAFKNQTNLHDQMF